MLYSSVDFRQDNLHDLGQQEFFITDRLICCDLPAKPVARLFVFKLIKFTMAGSVTS
jgi:hypothetical protein